MGAAPVVVPLPRVHPELEPAGPALVFTAAEWSAFTARVRADDFD
ncbi:MAG: DUF397 domain-containing protein [Pseudonocardiaceae bacterium]